MAERYGSHADYMSWVADAAEARQTAVVSALREAFGHAIETRTVEVIVFSRVGVVELAAALMSRSRSPQAPRRGLWHRGACNRARSRAAQP